MKKFRLAVAGAVSAACLLTVTAPANADPGAVERAKERLEAIQAEASAIDQEIIEAAHRANEAEGKLETVNKDLAEQLAKVDSMTEDLGAIAIFQMQSGGFDVTTQLLTSDSDESFLSSLATIQNETDRSNAALQELQVGQARVAELRAEADQTNSSLQADLEAKKELAKEYEEKEAEAKAVYDRLNAEEQERLRQLELERQRQQDEADRLAREAAERERQAAAARNNDSQNSSNNNSSNNNSRSRNSNSSNSNSGSSSNGNSNNSNSNSSNSNSSSSSNSSSNNSSSSSNNNSNSSSSSKSSSSESTATGSASSRAQGAVQAALAQVGKPYVWGTSGPNTFDCSGLTSYAYRQVGVSIVASSRGQATLGKKVAKSDLQPGDLVFYYSPISHVGMYIGNGKIVHAANPRSGINVTSLNSMPFTTARRVA